jgi:phospholipase/carboxylesterase
MKDTDAPIEIETGPAPKSAIIWLHGLGADGNDFVPIAGELNLPFAVRYVFPHAPHRPVTLNAGYVMRAWYDIAMDTEKGARGIRQHDAHIEESLRDVSQCIRNERKRGIASTQIVLAGFSQGGLIAFRAGLEYPEELAGIMALSAPLTAAGDWYAKASAANRQTPIFLAHGSRDGVVPVIVAHMARTALTAAGAAFTYREYAMEHSVSLDEIAHIRAWLIERLREHAA